MSRFPFEVVFTVLHDEPGARHGAVSSSSSDDDGIEDVVDFDVDYDRLLEEGGSVGLDDDQSDDGTMRRPKRGSVYLSVALLANNGRVLSQVTTPKSPGHAVETEDFFRLPIQNLRAVSLSVCLKFIKERGGGRERDTN